jgi:CRP/FNR family transcriptional regulator
MVRSGRVAISNSFEGASPHLASMVGPNGFFGEAVLVGRPRPLESLVALDQTRVTLWDRAEIEQQMSRDARLALALLTYFVRRCSELGAHLEALTVRKTSERVMLALLQLAETLGHPLQRCLRLASLTHQAIAEYVGASREIVASEMCELRRSGLLQYSRKDIELDASLMRETLRQRGIDVVPAQSLFAGAAI